MTNDIDVIDAAIEGYWGTGTMDQLGDQAREIARTSMRRALTAACAVTADGGIAPPKLAPAEPEAVAFYMFNAEMNARTSPRWGVPSFAQIEWADRAGYEIRFLLAGLQPERSDGRHGEMLRAWLERDAKSRTLQPRVGGHMEDICHD